MIIGENAIPVLHVEGKNDMYVIGELMKAFDCPLVPKKGPVHIQSHDSCEALLDSFVPSVKSSVGLGCSVGFVLDMDRPEDNRVEQIRERLRLLGLELKPNELTDGGIVKEIDGIKVGVWLMPSPAAKSGKLEDFLRAMVGPGDVVQPLADHFVGDVGATVSPTARFRDIDREKAQMYAWLAVQPTPGLPYGSAINARYLSPTNPLANKFAQWMSNVFSLSITCKD